MTAEALGARLLREVKEESLDELLQSLRIRASPFSSTFKFPPFDDVVRSQYPAPQPAPPSSLTANRPHRSSSSDLPADPNRAAAALSLLKPPTVHLTSSRASSGKTQLLYYTLALTILPQVYHTSTNGPVQLPGRNFLTIFYDTDARFSALRLQQVLRDVLSTHAQGLLATQSLSAEDADGVINQSLRLLHIFRPQSTAQLLANLTSLSKYVLNLQPPSSLHPLGALILDSMSSFYWPDRLARDLSRLPPDSTQSSRDASTNLVPQILTSLRTIQSTFSCPIIYTTRQGLNPFPPNFPTVTLKLERVPVPRIPPFMSVEEAGVRERELRWHEVAKGRFSATVMDNNTAGILSARDVGERQPWLGFRITADGVEIEGNGGGGE